MKFNRTITTLGSAALMLGMAGMVHAGVADTKHNLTDNANTVYSADGNAEICVFCHTPHNAQVASADNTLPLWNHTLSTVANYGVYSSSTLDATVTDVGKGDTISADNATVSNLCLSCHDGTIAINSVTNPSNNWSTMNMTGVDGDGTLADAATTNLGRSLVDDHPVNFSYSDVVAVDTGINAVAAAEGAGMRFFGADKSMQCASCHDPHTSVNKPFLRASATGSTLCLGCHNK